MIFINPWLAVNPLPPAYTADAAEFDGTSDSMTRSAGQGQSGFAADSRWTVSFWCKFNGGDGARQSLFRQEFSGQFSFDIQRQANNKWSFSGRNASNSVVLNIETTDTWVAASGWHHVFMSCDLSGTAVAKLYVNGADNSDVNTATNSQTINFSNNQLTRFSAATGGSPTFLLNGAIADFWFATGVYLDPATTPNLRKFINSHGKPMPLGADGSTPTGNPPLVFFHLDEGEAANNFALNRGTSDDWPVTGSLVTAATSPTD